MADLTLDATEVLPDTTGDIFSGIAGEAITAGQSVYFDSTTSKVKKADSNALATAAAIGIALNGASTSQPVRVQRSGDVTLGATAAPAVGTVYMVSDTAGGIKPHGDLATGDYTTVLGFGMTGNKLRMWVSASGVVK